MTFKKLGKQALALSLAVVIAIFGCAFVLGPAKASSAADADKEIAYQTINVSTVDEFIAALGSNRKIVLAPGKYDMTTKCSCPDYANPCKHSSAVLLLLGEEVARRPATLLELRGISLEELYED